MANKENEPDRSRFKQLSDEEIAGLTLKFVPKNTDKTTKWALKNFSVMACHEPTPKPLVPPPDFTLLEEILQDFED